MGAYTLGLCVAFLKLDFFKSLFFGGSELHFLTAFYALFIFLGIFNCFSARCERMWILSNIGKNRPFVIIMLLISAIQILMIFFGGALFRTTPITPAEIVNVILLAATIIPFDAVCRIFKKLSPKRE
jgi:magnesium-transporting ATPase (P-type)